MARGMVLVVSTDEDTENQIGVILGGKFVPVEDFIWNGDVISVKLQEKEENERWVREH